MKASALSERLKEQPWLAQLAWAGSAGIYHQVWQVGALCHMEGPVPGDRARIKLEEANGAKHAVVSACGTNTLEQWADQLCSKTQIRTLNHGERKVRVHQSFWQAAESMWKSLKKAVLSAIQEKKVQCILFTGHSRGAALALILFYKALHDEDEALKGTNFLLVTFASPRVGDEGFAAQLTEAASSRGGLETIAALLVNRFDAVPLVPPWFKHPINPAKIGSALEPVVGGIAVLCNALMVDKPSASPVFGALVKQHDIEIYRKNLDLFCNVPWAVARGYCKMGCRIALAALPFIAAYYGVEVPAPLMAGAQSALVTLTGSEGQESQDKQIAEGMKELSKRLNCLETSLTEGFQSLQTSVTESFQNMADKEVKQEVALASEYCKQAVRDLRSGSGINDARLEAMVQTFLSLKVHCTQQDTPDPYLAAAALTAFVVYIKIRLYRSEARGLTETIYDFMQDTHVPLSKLVRSESFQSGTVLKDAIGEALQLLLLLPGMLQADCPEESAKMASLLGWQPDDQPGQPHLELFKNLSKNHGVQDRQGFGKLLQAEADLSCAWKMRLLLKKLTAKMRSVTEAQAGPGPSTFLWTQRV